MPLLCHRFQTLDLDFGYKTNRTLACLTFGHASICGHACTVKGFFCSDLDEMLFEPVLQTIPIQHNSLPSA